MTKPLSDLTAEIADEIDDTTGEYGPQILASVQGAQRFCERQTYYFNETRDVTFVTVAAQEWYGAAANANIPTLVRIQAAYYIDSGGNVIPMRRALPEDLEALGGTGAAQGQPINWTYFNKQIRLYPIPNAVYTVRLQIGPYRLTTLVSPTDTNAWLDEAYDLIKARSKYNIYKNVIKDANLAIEAKADWAEQDEALAGETASRNGTGRIRATRF